MIRSPPSKKGTGTENDDNSKEYADMSEGVDIAELQERMKQQERIIRQLQEQQRQPPPPGMASGSMSPGDYNLGNFIYFSIRDALEAVPIFNGDNITFSHFVEGCEEALSMIAPSQEIILVRAIRNKLKGDAHRSILGKIFNSLQELVEFLRKKYGPRETVYEAQARLAYICQRDDEKVSSYSNRVREIGKHIIDAQKRQSNGISRDFEKAMEEHLKICFLRGLNPEIQIKKEGTFDDLESRAIDAERELETIKTIRQVVLGEKISNDNKRTVNASLRRVGTEPIVTCQYCKKIGHTADRCRFIIGNQPGRNFAVNTNSGPRNFLQNNQNLNNTQTPPPPGSQMQNSRNMYQVECRYCKKPGHIIENCRKRIFNNQSRNIQIQGNGQIPATTGTVPGNTKIRPARAITTETDIDIE